MTKFAGLNKASGSNPKAGRFARWCRFRGVGPEPCDVHFRSPGRRAGLTAPARGGAWPAPRSCAMRLCAGDGQALRGSGGRDGGPHGNFRDRAVRRIDIESNEYPPSGIAFGKYWFLDPSAKQNGGAGGLRASRAAPPGAGSPAGLSKAVLCGRTSAKLAACLREAGGMPEAGVVSAPRRPPTGPGSWRSRPGSPRASRLAEPAEAREAGRRWLEGSLDNAAEGVGMVFVAACARDL